MVNRERCAVSCSTLDIYCCVYVPNDTEDLNLYLVNMITGINKSKTLTKRISCTFECKFYSKKFNSNQNYNYKCQCEFKNPKSTSCKQKIVFGVLQHAVAKICGSIIDDSVIVCDKIIKETKTIPASYEKGR